MNVQIVERKYTSGDFEQMPEFAQRFELIDGRIVKKPMPVVQHGRVEKRLIIKYYIFDPDEKLGEMVPESSVKLNQGNVPVPDVAYWKSEHSRSIEGMKAGPVPDLAVEVWSEHDVASQNRQDEARAKVKRYLANGVSVVWVINLENRTAEVYQPDQMLPVAILTVDQKLDGGKVIPGFKVRVGDLFE